ncbi:hypothetical protein CHS0354_004241 [Potamilus streckersoni]|uniref:Uncharacterized protein n=1 Tax=Potamilus streckersoni TaxID=2493646 RepID=A0AAE0VNT3_9BIVA|nr:hypothetical protein CHS0354_004241 [Potamilus streckersoni]
MLTIGDMYSNDVIAKTLVTIDMALNSEYWQGLPFLVSQGVCNSDANGKLSTWQNNIIQALKLYPGFKGLTPPADSKLAMPLTWPYGTYALPKPTSGCPKGWVEGTRTQLQSSSHSAKPAHPPGGAKGELLIHMEIKEFR